MYQHEQYSYMYKEYHVPKEACYPYQLMSKVDADRDILYRVRCAPLNAFYSMIMEDTPGYIPSSHWSKPPLAESSRSSSRSSDRGASASISRAPARRNQETSKSQVLLRKTSSGAAPNTYRPGAIKTSNGVRDTTPLLVKRRVIPMKAGTIQIMTTVFTTQDYFQQIRGS